MPHARRWDELELFPAEIIPELGKLGFLGINIAERYLMAKQFKANGLREGELKIQESALREQICELGRSMYERGLKPGSSGNDSARRFLAQADTAVKANNLLLAQSSVEKAEALANGLR